MGGGWEVDETHAIVYSQPEISHEVATVIPNHSIVLNRCLAVVGANFRSTASNWCPQLALIAHL